LSYPGFELNPHTRNSKSLVDETKNKQQFNTSSLFYRGHTLPDVITLEYPNFENPVD
jgi:hypothetical protein